MLWKIALGKARVHGMPIPIIKRTEIMVTRKVMLLAMRMVMPKVMLPQVVIPTLKCV